MKTESLLHALNFIQEIKSLFLYPETREEEEIHHLLSAVQWRLRQLLQSPNEKGKKHCDHDR